MKKILFLMAAVLIAGLAIAQSIQGNGAKRVLKSQQITAQLSHSVKSAKSKLPKKAASSPQKIEGDFTIIEDMPEGDRRVYVRSGKCYVYDENYEPVVEEQSGAVTVVFAADNEVYIKDPIANFRMNTWVRGTVSTDGKTITLPMFQGLSYQEEYDEYIILALGKLEDGSIVADPDVEEITFTVDGETLTLNGTSEQTPLGAFWSSDDMWAGMGEWDTKYQMHNEDYTLITPPENLTTTDMPLAGKNIISEDEVASTVKVGTSGSEVYIQGLAPLIPEAWVKGILADGEVTFDKQFVGYLDGEPCFMTGYDDENDMLTPLVMSYDAELNAYDAVGLMILNPNTLNLVYEEVQACYLGLHIGARPDVITPPDGMETTAMRFSGLNYDDEDVKGTANVGFDGNDVYIQGLLKQVSEGWIKGSFNEDKTQVTFPCGQYVGLSDEENTAVYILGTGSGDTGIGDVVFNYDETNNTFELQSMLFISERKDQIYFYDAFKPGFVIGKPSEISWIAGEQDYGDGQEIASIQFDEFTSGTLAKNNGAASPAYNQSDKTVFLNADNTLSISSSKKMAKIVLTMDGTKQQMLLTADNGTYTLQGIHKNLGTWEGESNNVVFTVPNNAQARVKAVNIFYFDYSTHLVEVPEDLETCAYSFAGFNLEENEETVKEVNIGFYGENEVYIQGLSEYVEDAWVKGELKDGVLTIPDWFLGYYDSFYGFLEIVFTPAKFTFDKENDIFTSDGFTSYSEKMSSVMDEYENVVLTKIIEKPTMPKQPVITEYKEADYGNSILMEIPAKDTDDKPILSSKLCYQIFVDINKEVSELVFTTEEYEYLTEDMTVIPYNFTDYYDFKKHGQEVFLNQSEQESWNKIGVKSIYTGGGETNETEISWYVLRDYDSDGISNITVDNSEQPIFNLQGIRVSKMQQNGLYIKGGKKFIRK